VRERGEVVVGSEGDRERETKKRKGREKKPREKEREPFFSRFLTFS
jgi:hypothetical protein